MKDDEIKFLILMYNNRHLIPRFIINDKTKIDINHKRALYILYKNVQKGYYDYGVSLDTGWLTEEGIYYIKNNLLKEL